MTSMQKAGQRFLVRVAIGATSVLAATVAFAQQEANTDPQSTACDHVFTKGSGASQISYCVNAHGNVMSFIAPAGVEHIRVGGFADGYAVCSGSFGVHGYDFGGGESLWGPNVLVAGPTATGVTYARTTFDGRIRLEHKFILDSVEGDVKVEVKVINLTAASISDVRYKRISDFDAAGVFTNLWTRSLDEVEALFIANPAAYRGISLNAITFATPHATSMAFGNFTDCGLPVSAAQGAVGDLAAQILYGLGDIGSLKSKIVKIVYKRK